MPAAAVAFATVLPTQRSNVRLDALGLALVVLLAVWVGLFAGEGEGRPWPLLLLLAGMVAATVVGRALANRRRPVWWAVAAGIAGSIVLTWPGVLSPAGPPLGYANANATLSSLGVIGALGAARAESDAVTRRAWVGLAGVLAAFTVASGSAGGVLALAVALGLLGLSALTRWAGFAVVGGLIAVSIALGVTTAVALGSDAGSLAERAGVRAELWTAAAELAKEEPVRGIGPGEFAERTPVSADADLRWAHHGFLQVAAELGLVGFAIVAGLAGCAWTLLWRAARSDPASAALSAAAVTLVGFHATVDYVWHLPPVLMIMCLLQGSAGVGEQRESSLRPGDRHQDLLEGRGDGRWVDLGSSAVLHRR